MVVGMKVTLRGKRMNDFLLKLTKITLPCIRDFQGISRSTVDANGNIAIGFREALCFPEIRSDEVELAHGLEVNIISTAGSREEGLVLFQALGIPFKK